MKKILITGASGNLAGKIRRRLEAEQVSLRLLSRQEPVTEQGEGVEWAVAHLTSGEGVSEALQGVDTIIHTASSPFPASVELKAGQHLLTAAKEQGIRHMVYISILGVDRISFSYYQSKLEVEGMIKDSGVPYTIQRSAQFHRFVEMIIEGLARLPVILLPKDWQFQSISAEDVASRVAQLALGEPQQMMPAMAGPEILALEDMLDAWLEINKVSKPVIQVPIPGGLSRGFRSGHNTSLEHRVDGVSWRRYLIESARRESLNVGEVSAA